MTRGLFGVLLLAWGCGDSARLKPVDVRQPEVTDPSPLPPDAGEGLVELEVPDAGAGAADAGSPDAGAPDAGTSLPPAELSNLAAGALFSCALSQGNVYCWGKNDKGQLGIGNSFNTAVPAKVLNVNDAIAVSAGQDHACALGANGRIWCWGANDLGQLGRGTQTAHEPPDFVPGLLGIRQVSVGEQGHTCALTTLGQVACWGRGLGNSGAASMVPQPKSGLAGVKSISVGDHHVCVVTSADQAWCWGGNSAGALGDGTKLDRQTPGAANGLPPVKQVVAANGYSCAVDLANAVWCWGRGESGQLGVNTDPEVLQPRLVAGASGDQVIASKGLHTCLRSTSGSVGCFGSNAVGQLGNGTSGLSPELAPVATGITDAVAGSAGAFHTCVRRATGAVSCWGINSDGQLGDGHSGTLSMNAVDVVGLP